MPSRNQARPFHLFAFALAGLSTLSVILLGLGAIRGNGSIDLYLVWNLFLAWIPLFLSYALAKRSRRQAWSSWSCIGLSLAWLLFLPNSFYMVSDLIHLEDIPRVSVLYDALTFTSFTVTGLILGYASLYMVQAALDSRISRLQNELFAAVMLLLCSFAIYLGRDLRWNSWDVLLNPAGILFDVSERIIDPLGHPEAFTTTLVFFIFLAGLYWAAIVMVRAIGLYARHRKTWE
jgi:uncharacterized membrane protein